MSKGLCPDGCIMVPPAPKPVGMCPAPMPPMPIAPMP
eukprot:CAMPEP_0195530168 /NCGR_PEP_ID=MMETSP0794_2-20130614/32969_1 /TAXON_ID=515487 /ORGANISM="Stephanopyxis turris, Strain CCMP 815" /LENGTH=36 /DNA_ID= /DNA_START= /DNA_END= /DNA_ORIENTATION=